MHTILFHKLKACTLLAALLFPLALGGCGKKPGSVDAPPDMTHQDTFPRTYPDVETDPAPTK